MEIFHLVGALFSFGIVVICVAGGVRGAAWSDVFQAILMPTIWVLGLYFVNNLHNGIGDMFGKIIEQNPDFQL